VNASVIIPAFNAEKTIKKTVDSVLNQTNPPEEIIIVNDGSTDRTKEIAEGIAGENHSVKVFSRNNSGISSARNFGASQAKQELIVFLDSDVTAERQWLEKLIAGLKKNVFAVCGKYSVEPGNSLSSDFFSFVVGSSSFQGYNIAFRKKDFLESGGFSEKMKYCEDPEFFLRAFLKGKKIVSNKAETFHRNYPLKERIKSNFKYSFFDAVLFRENFLFFAGSPLRLFKAPENIRMIYSFYMVVFSSVLLALLAFIFSGSIYSFIFLLVPSTAGTIKIALSRNKIRYKNNFMLIAVYSFFALFLFGLVKGAGFVIGLIQGKA